MKIHAVWRGYSPRKPGALVFALALWMFLSLAMASAQENPEEEEFSDAAPSVVMQEINPEEEIHDRTQSPMEGGGAPTMTRMEANTAKPQYDPTTMPIPLLERVTPEVLERIFPEADRLEIVQDEGPFAASAYSGDRMLGYVFSTLDVLRAPGYSSTPFDVISGVTLDGRIAGGVLIFHREPYLMNDRFRTARMIEFLDFMKGMEGRLGAEGGFEPGFVAGATISARAMRNAVLEGARMVLGYRTDENIVTEPTIDIFNFRPMSPDELLANGAITVAHVTNADLQAAMERAGFGDLLPEVPMIGGDDDTYIDFAIGYGNPPAIGRNGVGPEAFERLVHSMPSDTMAIYVASLSGAYDHRGIAYNNLARDFAFERVTIEQDGKQLSFQKKEILFSNRSVADLLIVPSQADFDPMKPWSARLYASARRPDGRLERFVLAELNYQLPPHLILMPEKPAVPVWVEPWVEGRTEIAILGTALLALTLILALQDRLSRNRRLHRWVRNGFLVFTLVWIGWIASAQLSIVHLINYIKAPIERLGIGFYLAEPLIVMLSIYTAISLIFLGRGVFCGWLCPFGAMQELMGQISRALGLPQWNPKEPVQKYLWNLKYVSLGLILVLVFVAPTVGALFEEIEPFKTAITAKFVRGLPYVIYAVMLLVVGLFTERAFCRFLCPLGGALAVLDRLHLLDLLKRRPECGNPCHLCERSCPVRAIERSGKIVMAECFQCLDCQVEYYDDQRCPPLAQARKKREREAAIPKLGSVVLGN
jgi:NosR/NirI family nitrous oxide reductase transcriptional regulator